MPSFLLGNDITVRKVKPTKKIEEMTTKANTTQVAKKYIEVKTKTATEAANGERVPILVIEPSPECSKPVTEERHGEFLWKHISNITLILQCSNATPILNHNELGFVCGFCDDQYKNPEDLKQHTTETHEQDDIRKSRFLWKRNLSNLVVQLDITDLRCKLCDKGIDKLEELIDHLNNNHSKKIFTDIKNQIIPLKLHSEVYRCFMCMKVYDTFKPLVEHMRSHYQNYVCEICGDGFFDMANLRIHSETHKIGTFKCEHCFKIFNTELKMKAHKIIEHTNHVESKTKTSTEPANADASNSFAEKHITHYKVEESPKRGEFLWKHVSNLSLILHCSNATLIRNYNEVGFTCGYCDDQYKDPADLKRHTTETHEHDNVRKSIVLLGTSLTNLVVKLDITDLRCKICNDSIDTLEQMIDHLKNKHSRNMFTVKTNQIIPLKFETFDGEVFRCSMCVTAFNKFKTLIEHMTSHYQNYVCEICGAGFFGKGNLKLHSEIHKIGSFKCNHCSKVFNTAQKQKAHTLTVHTLLKLHKCRFCNETFKHNRQKWRHLSEAHDVPYTIAKCNVCDKTFLNKRSMQNHTRKVHLMERNYNCSECDMSFFSKDELNRHMVKHTGVRQFQCGVCMKAFLRKKTLTQHMRRLHVDGP